MTAMFPRVIVLEQLMKLFAHHRAAGSAGRDDVVIGLKNLDESLGQFLGFGMKTVVEERLATTGLGAGKVHDAVEAFQYFRYRNADLRIELVGQAGDEKSDVTGHDFADALFTVLFSNHQGTS